MNLSALRSRFFAAVATGALLAPGFAAPVAAGGFEIDVDRIDRFEPIDVGDKPCDDEHFKKYVCSPDFTATVSTALSYPSVDGGIPATFFLVTVHNDSKIDGDGRELVTLIGLDQSRILKVEPFVGPRDWTVEYVNEDDGSAVFLRHPNGLNAGEFTTVAVWYAGYDFTEFAAIANVRESSIGGFGPLRFDQLESDTTNNRADGDLEWPDFISKMYTG